MLEGNNTFSCSATNKIMKRLYCWRCDTEIPMLDEDEWESVAPLLENTIQKIKEYRTKHDCSLNEARRNVNQEACKKYFEITGYEEINFEALYHHRVSLYGPPCKECGKPLRTPQAKICASCGTKT